MNDISETDWKLLRKLKTTALERLCERILQQVTRQCGPTGESNHQRFLRTFSLIENGNDDISRAFNDLRRSTAFERLAAMISQGLISDDELREFSVETRKKIRVRLENR